MMDINYHCAIEDHPKYPSRTLLSHVAMKGIQVGSIGGLIITTPFLKYITKSSLKDAWTRSMIISPIAGGMMTLSLLYYKHTQGLLNIDFINDRAYRISKNQNQTKVDTYSIIGASIGCSIGALFIRSGMKSIISCSSTGVAVGLMYYTLESKGILNQVKSYFK